MQDRICLITGASAGLGKAAAAAIAHAGGKVVLGCRDRARAEAARAEIQTASGNPAVNVLLVDLSVQRSIRNAAADVRKKYGRLDILVNNAAVFKRDRTVTTDELETMFATNHVGPFLLTTLLLDLLRASAPARIINIAAPSTTRLDFDDLQSQRRFRALTAFGASKMANLLFTYELARRLDGTGVTVNALHPGVVRTNLMAHAPAPVRLVANLFAAAPEQAAESVAYLALSADVASVTGQFFKGTRPSESNAYSHDPDHQRRLWNASVALTSQNQLR